MPAITIQPHSEGFHFSYYGVWDWSEEYTGKPDDHWFVTMGLLLMKYRRRKVYRVTDEIRAELIAHHAIVEYDGEKTIVKW